MRKGNQAAIYISHSIFVSRSATRDRHLGVIAIQLDTSPRISRPCPPPIPFASPLQSPTTSRPPPTPPTRPTMSPSSSAHPVRSDPLRSNPLLSPPPYPTLPETSTLREEHAEALSPQETSITPTPRTLSLTTEDPPEPPYLAIPYSTTAKRWSIQWATSVTNVCPPSQNPVRAC